MEPSVSDWTAVDASRPSPARVCDYLLGGKDNFAADRDLAARMQAEGDVKALAAISRSFVLAAARYCGSALGAGQFLDLGCGLPRRPAVHDTAREGYPGAVVVYADRDPVVISHVRALQAGPGLAAVLADAGDPAGMLEAVAALEAPGGGRLVDFGRPVCLIFGGTLSSMPAGVARDAVRGYAAAVAAGSCAIISCASYQDQGLAGKMAALYGAAGEWHNHDRETVASFFEAGGLRVLRGRVGDVRCWPLEDGAEGTAVIGGIGVRD